MAHLHIIWEDTALRLLESRDRYTRNAIREEFRRDPERNAIEIDPTDRSCLTPVSDSRFSVIWHREGERVVVRAVIPLTNLDTLRNLAPPGKKAYVGKIVATESNGEITF
jgi:hypothetical protein